MQHLLHSHHPSTRLVPLRAASSLMASADLLELLHVGRLDREAQQVDACHVGHVLVAARRVVFEEERDLRHALEFDIIEREGLVAGQLLGGELNLLCGLAALGVLAEKQEVSAPKPILCAWQQCIPRLPSRTSKPMLGAFTNSLSFLGAVSPTGATTRIECSFTSCLKGTCGHTYRRKESERGTHDFEVKCKHATIDSHFPDAHARSDASPSLPSPLCPLERLCSPAPPGSARTVSSSCSSASDLSSIWSWSRKPVRVSAWNLEGQREAQPASRPCSTSACAHWRWRSRGRHRAGWLASRQAGNLLARPFAHLT